MTFGSLFAGIGGLDLGLERAGMECRWQVEIDEFANQILSREWPHVKRYGDVTTVDGLERVDLIAGGFPCQDLSCAGKRAGIDGERSGLWSHYARIIREIRPRSLLAALKEFMDMWNSGDSTNQSKRAQQRRAEMWDKANAAVKLAEGRHAD